MRDRLPAQMQRAEQVQLQSLLPGLFRQIKKMTRDIRVSQMGSPNTEVMVNLTSRLNTVEKKITEVEEEFSKLMKNKPVVME